MASVPEPATAAGERAAVERTAQERDDALAQLEQAKALGLALTEEQEKVVAENVQLRAQQQAWETEDWGAQLEERDYRIKELEKQNTLLQEASAAAHDEGEMVSGSSVHGGGARKRGHQPSVCLTAIIGDLRSPGGGADELSDLGRVLDELEGAQSSVAELELERGKLVEERDQLLERCEEEAKSRREAESARRKGEERLRAAERQGATAAEELHAKGGEMRRAVAAEQVRTAAVKGQLAQVQAQLDALRTDGGLEAEQEQLPQRSLLDSVIDIQSTGCPAKDDAPEAAAAEEESVEREQVGGTI
jgi:hypothetical protein